MTIVTDRPLSFDPVAFALALVGGPLLATVALCWLIIPIFAVVLGGPLYLLIGSPILLWMVGRYPPDPWRFALAGFAANLGLTILCAAADAWVYALREAGIPSAFGMTIWGLIFGPLWGAAFAHLYRRFNRMQRLFPQS